MTTKIALSNIQDAVVTAITPTVPKITGISVTNSSYTVLDDTAVSISGGYIKITGTGFTAGSQVLIGTVAATSVSFVGSTELRAQLPATGAGTYVVYVVATDGAVAIRVNGITFSSTPAWSTGSTLTSGSINMPISIQLAATSDTTITYALAAGSSLPGGLSLSSSGVLSGTITGISVDTTYNFTVNAIDAELQDSPRAFSITITVVLQVARSLRFNKPDTTYLNRTPSSASNRKTYTWSGWVKRSDFSNDQVLFNAGTDSDNDTIRFNTDNTFYMFRYNSGFSWQLQTTQVFRDSSAWYHIVFVYDSTQVTSSNRIKLYVNGTQVTAFSTAAYPTLNFDSNIDNTAVHRVGNNSATNQFSGYMTEINFIDGQALTPASFGYTDSITGVWTPLQYTGSYGTNGYYLNFSDNSNTTAATLGKDYSGNGNNFTPNNFSVTAGVGNDSFVDSPTSYGTDTGVGGEVRGNYATWNLLAGSTSANPTLSNGNLDVTGSAGYWGRKISTIGMTTGKWYAEVTINSVGDNTLAFGVTNSVPTTDANNQNGEVSGYSSFIVTYYSGVSNYNRLYNSGYTTLGGNCSVGDIYGLAFDADAAKIYYYKNGSVLGSASGYTLTTNGQPFFFQILAGNAPVGAASTNFGQRAFAYTAPSGYKALCSQNLPTPAIGATSTTQASAYFNTVLYTGNGSTNAITGVGFQPDFTWIKSRSAAYNHRLFDQVRGVQNVLQANTTAADTSDGAGLTAFGANGFTLGSTVNQNENNSTFVAWNWNAGGSTVSNTAGTITSQVRANTTAGFSIVTYTGTGANATVGHGLGVAPSMILQKNRTGYDWRVYHVSAGNTNELYLNQTTAATATAAAWNNTTPTTTVFSVGSGSAVNGGGFACIAYCWAEVPGYSRFGSYVGNGSLTGPFIYTGFRPRFVMIKIASGATYNTDNWFMFDTVRGTYNDNNPYFLANSANAEVAYTVPEIFSNGFYLNSNSGALNYSASTFIYAAFAETPFKYARAR